jgi:hypothetical protein
VTERGGGCLREGLIQAGEVRDDLVHASDRENPQDGGVGDHQQHLAALSLGVPVRCHQGVKPGRITEPGAGHIDDEGAVPAGGRGDQGRPQAISAGDIDLHGSRHHRHAPGHLDREPDLGHLHHHLVRPWVPPLIPGIAPCRRVAGHEAVTARAWRYQNPAAGQDASI